VHSIPDLPGGRDRGREALLASRPYLPAVRVLAADDPIEEGDRLVVAGTRTAVEGLDVI
jgi:hypothetical protein